VETRRTSEPSAFITYCWSQLRPSRVLWKISRRPSALKYASAFSPPSVSWRTVPKWRSPESGVMVRAGLGGAAFGNAAFGAAVRSTGDAAESPAA